MNQCKTGKLPQRHLWRSYEALQEKALWHFSRKTRAFRKRKKDCLSIIWSIEGRKPYLSSWKPSVDCNHKLMPFYSRRENFIPREFPREPEVGSRLLRARHVQQTQPNSLGMHCDRLNKQKRVRKKIDSFSL